MDINELVIKQQLEIESLKETLKEVNKTIKDIYSSLYCIGGPLNDNCIKLNNKQIHYLYRDVGKPIVSLVKLLRTEE